MTMDAAFDRSALAEVLGAALAGRRPSQDALPPFDVATVGKVKTYILEVNGTSDASSAVERLEKLASRLDARFASTPDPTLALLGSNEVVLYVDVLDPRFWLVHTTSSATMTFRLLNQAIWAAVDLDWCWFPLELLQEVQSQGRACWFRSDFFGDDLLPTDGLSARRLRVQLEGDGANQLFELLSQDERFRHAAALTSLATRIEDDTLGTLDEHANYRGRFVPRGDSVELHLGFVSRAARSYRRIVEAVEAKHGITFGGDSDSGGFLDGRSVMIRFGRRIPEMDRFLSGLFSCKDPFRLWGIPRMTEQNFAQVNVVDLHIGETLRMEITPQWLRVLLPGRACGNTILRLVTNLQHRFDAKLDSDLKGVFKAA